MVTAMVPRVFALIFALVLAGGLPALPEQNPAHRIDPVSDVIIGELTAPHEMVIYLSPGCRHCLSAFSSVHDRIEQAYITPGYLRVVYRLVPQVYGVKNSDEERRIAGYTSQLLATNLRCAYARSKASGMDTEQADYIFVLRKTAQAFTEMTRDNPERLAAWPALEREDFTLLLNKLASSGAVDYPQLEHCNKPPASDQFAAYFTRNAQALLSVVGQDGLTLPAYFLNGQRIGGAGQDTVNMVLPALAETIPEAGQ